MCMCSFLTFSHSFFVVFFLQFIVFIESEWNCKSVVVDVVSRTQRVLMLLY